MPTPDDVEEFAGLLRRMKARTDRSYDALARRLHMNTSTLHRYCKGEAVPQEYAPVDRLAAFCGATPQERLELHRLWLSAVAARQQARTAGPPQAVPPAPTRPAGQGPQAEEGGSPERPGDAPAPADPVGRPAPGPWYRRRRTLASAAAACALLAGVGLAFALPDDGAPGAAPAGSADPRTGVPLTWSADSQIWDMGCLHDYVLDKPPARVPPPPVQQDAATWAAAQAAVHGRHTMVRISVQGRSSTAVVLEALRVRVVSRGSPAPGSAYAMDQGCGGGLTPRRFTVDLDVDRPVARPHDGIGSKGTVHAVQFPYRVSAGDPEVLLVDATTQTADARWYLELDWSCQGRTGTVRIDDRGRPFRTTSTRGMARYWYGRNDAGLPAWVPYPD